MGTMLFLGSQEIILIAIVILLLFGAKKIPELMHGLGKGVRNFKNGLNGNEPTDKNDSSKSNNADEQKQ